MVMLPRKPVASGAGGVFSGRMISWDGFYAQKPDGAALGDSTSLTALSLTPHALAPVAELPVLEIVSSENVICDLTQPATPSSRRACMAFFGAVGVNFALGKIYAAARSSK
jgi:hypothetical protein